MSTFSLRYVYSRDKLIPVIEKCICSSNPNLFAYAIFPPEAAQNMKHFSLWWKLLIIFIVDHY